jgi:hypothetical protein
METNFVLLHLLATATASPIKSTPKRRREVKQWEQKKLVCVCVCVNVCVNQCVCLHPQLSGEPRASRIVQEPNGPKLIST